MDVWIVAAAAGAGYVAQRLKNRAIRRHKFSPENLDIVRTGLQFGEITCRQCSNGSPAAMASSSKFEGENIVELDNFVSWGMISDSNSLAGPFKKEDVECELEGRVSSNYDEVVITSDSVPHLSREARFSYGYRRNRSRLRSTRINTKFIKPRTSLESCLMAQLYKKHAEIKEYTYSTPPSRKPILRPFLVSDGSRIISKAPCQSCCKPTRMEDFKQSRDSQQENKNVFCVPRSPKSGKEQVLVRSTTSKAVNGNQSNEQGFSDGTLLFLLGLTMGISYSLSGHRREIDRLKKSLKQTENLVQDLQEELQMKDMLTVKELTVENYECRVDKDYYFDNVVQTLSIEPKFDSSSKYCSDGNIDRHTEEESLRKIEAELEAELDRLGPDMNSFGLERKLSNATVLDEDSVPYAIKGDLRADLFRPEIEAYTETNNSSSSTPLPAHYPVSPKGLSLRLHEVIQSRLEERVKELERQLEYSRIHSWRDLSSSKSGSPTSHESLDDIHQPLVINLSGEALAAYNEAYDEFTKLSESDEEESNHSHREMAFDCGEDDDYRSSDGTGDGEDETENRSSDGSENGEDETERLLIRQIVEKARQGSPAVLKAQRAFLSTHEN